MVLHQCFQIQIFARGKTQITEIIGFFSPHLFYSSAYWPSLHLCSFWSFSLFLFYCFFSLFLQISTPVFLIFQTDSVTDTVIVRSLHVTVFGNNNHRTWKDFISPVGARNDLLYTNPSSGMSVQPLLKSNANPSA